MPSFDFDPTEYIDEIDDSDLVDEFVHRCLTSPSFKSRALKAVKEMAEDESVVSTNEYEQARYEFERGRYDEMMIHLERALGWRGLDKLRITR